MHCYQKLTMFGHDEVESLVASCVNPSDDSMTCLQLKQSYPLKKSQLHQYHWHIAYESPSSKVFPAYAKTTGE